MFILLYSFFQNSKKNKNVYISINILVALISKVYIIIKILRLVISNVYRSIKILCLPKLIF